MSSPTPSKASPVPIICSGIVVLAAGIVWALVFGLQGRVEHIVLGVLDAILGVLMLYSGLKVFAVRCGCDQPEIPQFKSPFDSPRPDFCTSCCTGLKQEFKFCPRCGKVA